MTLTGVVGRHSRRVHYAWIVLAVVFMATLAGVGVRAAPGVMIIPLQRAFGWDVQTISGAVSLNIILLGATGPFLAGLIQVVGLSGHPPSVEMHSDNSLRHRPPRLPGGRPGPNCARGTGLRRCGRIFDVSIGPPPNESC